MTPDEMDQVWPSKQHSLHARPRDYWRFSDIGWQRKMGLQGRIYGFRRAAELLYEGMCGGQSIRDLDTVIFPYATCWRHYIELQLKSLLAQLRALSDLPPENRHHHRIGQLWQEVRNHFTKVYSEDNAEVTAVNRVISQLANLDPDGQAFRYAELRNGDATLPHTDQINLTAFHEAMIGVANYLDAVEAGLTEDLATKREIDAYYAAEFGNDWSGF